jgi:Flp pilus assembly protein TadB
VNRDFTRYLPQSTPPTLLGVADPAERHASGNGVPMLWTIAVLLLILWLLGMVSSYTLGGFIHILLVLAIVAVLIRLIQGRSPVV